MKKFASALALIVTFLVGPSVLPAPPKMGHAVGQMRPMLPSEMAQFHDSRSNRLAKRLLLAEMKLAARTSLHAQPGEGGIMPCEELEELPGLVVYESYYWGQGMYLGVIFNFWYISSNLYDGICAY